MKKVFLLIIVFRLFLVQMKVLNKGESLLDGYYKIGKVFLIKYVVLLMI